MINADIVGGAERHTFKLAEQLSDRGHIVSVFAIKPGLTTKHAVPLDAPTGSTPLHRRIRELARRIVEDRPDVIVAVNQRPLLVAWIARMLAREPRTAISVIHHTTILRDLKERIMQIGYTPLFNRAQSLVSISANQSRYWRQRGFRSRNEVVILNGIDTTFFSPQQRDTYRGATRAAFGIKSDTMVVGITAVLRPEKNHVQLMEAIRRLSDQGIDLCALVVGDGPMRPTIEERARVLGITERVIFAGMHADVRPLVAAFDIGVICSLSVETLSLSALEVMALGIPMVMSDIGGASEIIDGTNGELFDAGDLAGLCSALATFADRDRRQAAGVSARATVVKKFDMRSMADAYERHFADLRTSGNRVSHIAEVA